MISRTTSKGLFSTRTPSSDSMATSVPFPTAMPTYATASADASSTPSPTIATSSPSDWSGSTLVFVCLRSVDGVVSVIPSSLSTLS